MAGNDFVGNRMIFFDTRDWWLFGLRSGDRGLVELVGIAHAWFESAAERSPAGLFWLTG